MISLKELYCSDWTRNMLVRCPNVHFHKSHLKNLWPCYIFWNLISPSEKGFCSPFWSYQFSTTQFSSLRLMNEFPFPCSCSHDLHSALFLRQNNNEITVLVVCNDSTNCTCESVVRVWSQYLSISQNLIPTPGRFVSCLFCVEGASILLNPASSL